MTHPLLFPRMLALAGRPLVVTRQGSERLLLMRHAGDDHVLLSHGKLAGAAARPSLKYGLGP